MFTANLLLYITDKRTGKTAAPIDVMEMRYKISENVLWVTDHRGSIFDFDLDDFSVEVKSKMTEAVNVIALDFI